MVLVTPDLDAVIPKYLYQQLVGKYPTLYTNRSAPADLAGRPTVVAYRAGGVLKGGSKLLDQPLLMVDVYATTDHQVNQLSELVRGVLDAMKGHDPVVNVSTTGPAVVSGAGRGPQRQMTASVLVRRNEVTL